MKAALLLSTPSPPLLPPKLPTVAATTSLHLILTLTFPYLRPRSIRFPTRRHDFRAPDDDVDYSVDLYMDDEEVDNKKDYDVEYEPLAAGSAALARKSPWCTARGSCLRRGGNRRLSWITGITRMSFISVLFDVEMYVTPSDTDIYSIPKVLAPMPQKNHQLMNLEILFSKSEREISKVFLTKHYRNQRLDDTEFVLDFEEIYVIDPKSRSITRGKILKDGIGIERTCLS